MKRPEIYAIRCCAFAVFISVMLAVAAAQTLSPDEVRFSSHPYYPKPSFRVESQLVHLEVVVRNTRGRPVCGLAKDDFTVYDSGKSRELTAFSEDFPAPPPTASHAPPSTASQPALPPGAADRRGAIETYREPRWIALVFDDLNTPSGDIAHAKVAARRFLLEATGVGDRVGLFTTSGAQMLHFTSDSATIQAALNDVQSHLRVSPASCPRISPWEAYQIVNGDMTVFQAKAGEACHCGGDQDCSAADASLIQFSRSTSTGVGDDTYGGTGGGDMTIAMVRSQAEQIWERSRLASLATLEAIRATVNELRRTPGRRFLLLASSGFVAGTLDGEQDAITDEALRAGVVISSVDSKGLYTEAPGSPINESSEESATLVKSLVLQVESLGQRLDSEDFAMARFAESTGGLLFRNNNDLDLGFRQVGLVPGCAYLMGFPPAQDGKYHKVRVEFKKRSHEFIQVRPGYFAPTITPSPKQESADTIDVEVNGSGQRTELQATSTETFGNVSPGGRQLTVHTHLDLQNVAFRMEKGRHVQELSFVAVLFDQDGRLLTGKEAVMQLALKPESFDRFQKSGVTGTMSLLAPPGDYKLRIVVKEAVNGLMSSTSKSIQIPLS